MNLFPLACVERGAGEKAVRSDLWEVFFLYVLFANTQSCGSSLPAWDVRCVSDLVLDPIKALGPQMSVLRKA